jgi:hypothetical protein
MATKYRLIMLRPNHKYTVCSLRTEDGKLIEGAWTKDRSLVERTKAQIQEDFPEETYAILEV